MLGQPISMLVPKAVGFRLSAALPEGATATGLVLTVTEMLRRHPCGGEVGGVLRAGRVARAAKEPGDDRQHVTRMRVDGDHLPDRSETLRYLHFTGREPSQVDLVERYAKEQGLWFDPDATLRFSETVELDLATVVPSIAGPARPHDRVRLDEAKARLAVDL